MWFFTPEYVKTNHNQSYCIMSIENKRNTCYFRMVIFFFFLPCFYISWVIKILVQILLSKVFGHLPFLGSLSQFFFWFVMKPAVFCLTWGVIWSHNFLLLRHLSQAVWSLKYFHSVSVFIQDVVFVCSYSKVYVLVNTVIRSLIMY